MKSVRIGVLTLAFAVGSFAGQAGSKQKAPAVAAAPAAGQGTANHVHHHYSRPVVVPYAYPVYVGGYGDYGYGYDNGYATEPAPAPDVAVNQNFTPERATPVIREYGDDASNSSSVRVYDAPGPEPADSSAQDGVDYYLIAFKDHSIFSAFAYWVEGDTFHYVTAQRVHNQASLSLVDRELTARLNRNHNMQVKLPN